jgi:hypothetical protein
MPAPHFMMKEFRSRHLLFIHRLKTKTLLFLSCTPYQPRLFAYLTESQWCSLSHRGMAWRRALPQNLMDLRYHHRPRPKHPRGRQASNPQMTMTTARCIWKHQIRCLERKRRRKGRRNLKGRPTHLFFRPRRLPRQSQSHLSIFRLPRLKLLRPKSSLRMSAPALAASTPSASTALNALRRQARCSSSSGSLRTCRTTRT